jgi:virginiamycin B lyase
VALAGLLPTATGVDIAVAAPAPTVQILEFPLPRTLNGPSGITATPGHVWFAEELTDRIGRIGTASREITEITLPRHTSPVGMATHRSGTVWFTAAGSNSIGRIDPQTRKVTTYPIPTKDSMPLRIIAGPDGAMWFTEFHGNRIGRIDATSGAITEFPLLQKDTRPFAITAGADGALWFIEQGPSMLGRLEPATGKVRQFPLPGAAGGIATGPDGRIWATDQINNTVQWVDLDGKVQGRHQIADERSIPTGIVPGPDGAMWFTDFGRDRIGRIDPTTHEYSEYRLTHLAAPNGITLAPDGTLWFTEFRGNRIGRIDLAEPSTITVTSPSTAGKNGAGDQVCASHRLRATASPAPDPGRG